MDTSEVKKLAELAKLNLTPEEAQRFAGELSNIVKRVLDIQAVNTESVEPLFQVNDLRSVFREDVVGDTLDIESVLENAPDTSGRFIRVPIVIDEGEGN